MKTRPDQLSALLTRKAFNFFLLSGDEPLLLQETRDAILRHGKQQGYEEIIRITLQTDTEWQQIQEEAQHLSLFSRKRIVDVRFSHAKITARGMQVLTALCQDPPSHLRFVFSMPKLDARSETTAWYKRLDQVCCHVPIWPIDRAKLPQWLKQRLSDHKLQASQDAINELAAMTEGNLLAASQAVELLSLRYGTGTLSYEDVREGLADQARYLSFDALDQALLGNSVKTLRILHHLQLEDEEPALILLAFIREIRLLIQARLLMAQGTTPNTALTQLRVRETRKPFMQSCLQRITLANLLLLLKQAATIDQIIKGATKGNSWQALTSLGLSLASSSSTASPMPVMG